MINLILLTFYRLDDISIQTKKQAVQFDLKYWLSDHHLRFYTLQFDCLNWIVLKVTNLVQQNMKYVAHLIPIRNCQYLHGNGHLKVYRLRFIKFTALAHGKNEFFGMFFQQIYDAFTLRRQMFKSNNKDTGFFNQIACRNVFESFWRRAKTHRNRSGVARLRSK